MVSLQNRAWLEWYLLFKKTGCYLMCLFVFSLPSSSLVERLLGGSDIASWGLMGPFLASTPTTSHTSLTLTSTKSFSFIQLTSNDKSSDNQLIVNWNSKTGWIDPLLKTMVSSKISLKPNQWLWKPGSARDRSSRSWHQDAGGSETTCYPLGYGSKWGSCTQFLWAICRS